jgi:hypothetical protein
LPTLTDRLRTLWQVRGTDEILLFVRVLAFAPSVPLLMRLPLPRLERLLIRTARPIRGPRRVAPERLAVLVGLAQRLGTPVVRTGCVTRGVTLLWFLRRRGLDVALAFGIGGPADDFYGHCWLVLDGQPFLERDDPQARFVEQYRVPAVDA